MSTQASAIAQPRRGGASTPRPHAPQRGRALAALLACLLAVSLQACGGGSEPASASEAQPAAQQDDAQSPSETATKAGTSSAPRGASGDDATGAPYTLPAKLVIPTVDTSAGTPAIDVSGVAKGYVGAAATSISRLKFQVSCGEMTYNYDLPNDGTPTLFPLNMGDGAYRFRIMEKIEGNSYAELDGTTAEVRLESEFAPFLVPNVFCSYDASSACVEQAKKLMKNVENQGQAVREVCTYVAGNVSYDYEKAQLLAQSSGYVPNADETLKSKKGICFDYACLSAAMLRSLGLPAQVVTGYVSPDDLYHAWTMVYVDGTWQTAQFSVKPNTWSRCDVTFASAGSGATIGDGTTYTDRYIY